MKSFYQREEKYFAIQVFVIFINNTVGIRSIPYVSVSLKYLVNLANSKANFKIQKRRFPSWKMEISKPASLTVTMLNINYSFDNYLVINN